MEDKSKVLEETLQEFGVSGDVVESVRGPVISRIEYLPDPGTKISTITRRKEDIQRALASRSVRILAPSPESQSIGFEIESPCREIINLSEILELDLPSGFKVPLYLGKDTAGDPAIVDLVEMPHLLIAGATGSGKSVLIHSLISALMRECSPEEVQFLMIDPKRLELSIYEDAPHLLHDPVYSSNESADVLDWATKEMDRRYARLSDSGYRNLEAYNEAPETDSMARIVVVIDEFSDLLLSSSSGDAETCMKQLAQKARAAGIHLLISTQRPSAKVIDGSIRSNFPARIALRTSNASNSRIIVNESGAEELLGDGDMLCLTSQATDLKRVHGAYISTQEIRETVEWAKSEYESVESIELDPDIDMNPPVMELTDEEIEKLRPPEGESSWTSNIIGVLFMAFAFSILMSILM